ncbi:MAG: ABC transporter permease [Nitrospinota bacterium]
MSDRRQLLSGVLPQVGAIVLVLGLGALLVLAIGVSPVKAGAAFFDGAFGDLNSIGETLLKSAPLLLAALGVAVAFRARVWNIGAEGQLYLGGLASTATALALGPIPAVVLLPLTIVVSFLGGGLWAALAGVIKEKFGVNEIISTLMMNYVAFFGVSYLLHGPMKGPKQFYPESGFIPESGRLPVILPGSRLHAGILLGLLAAVVLYFVIFRTVLGYRIRAVGDNVEAARLGGISITRYVILSLFISGGLAGMAGLGEAAGVHYRLIEKISPGYGYTAIMVALMGKLHPGGIVAAAVFVGALLVGVDNMQRVARVPATLADILVGLSVLSILVSGYYPVVRAFLRRRFARVA